MAGVERRQLKGSGNLKFESYRVANAGYRNVALRVEVFEFWALGL